MESQQSEPAVSTDVPSESTDASQVTETPVSSQLPPPPDQQRSSIKAIVDAANQEGILEGKAYSLVPTKWWRRWKSFTGYDSGYSSENDTPGPIDNSDLLETVDGELVVKKARSWSVSVVPLCTCARSPFSF